MPLLNDNDGGDMLAAACRDMLRGGSRSFFAASLLLPHKVRQPAAALYAYCRLADDAIDRDRGGEQALALLRERLDLIYAGKSLPLGTDRAFAEVIARFTIPRALPEALLEGFAWDAAGRRYRTLTELLGYAVRVAGSVGMMMAFVMGKSEPAMLARACDLGVAMQLTNIARDVGEDAAAGRLYLPLAWLQEAGIDPEAWLANPVFSQPIGCVVGRLLRAADALYRRADTGVDRLPFSCRPGIRAARLLYAAIGHELAVLGFDSISRRAFVPAGRKAVLLPRAFFWRADTGRVDAAPLPQARALIEAADTADRLARTPMSAPWWRLTDRVVWVIELFTQLEHRNAVQSRGGA